MPAPDRRRQRIMDHGTDPALTQFVGHGRRPPHESGGSARREPAQEGLDHSS